MIRTIRKIARSASRKLNAALLARFANYFVWDCHGTKKPCWTLAGANEWIPYCSGRAAIVCANTRRIVLIREQEYAY